MKSVFFFFFFFGGLSNNAHTYEYKYLCDAKSGIFYFRVCDVFLIIKSQGLNTFSRILFLLMNQGPKFGLSGNGYHTHAWPWLPYPCDHIHATIPMPGILDTALHTLHSNTTMAKLPNHTPTFDKLPNHTPFFSFW